MVAASDAFRLADFVAHYRALGIDRLKIAVHSERRAEEEEAAEAVGMLRGDDCEFTLLRQPWTPRLQQGVLSRLREDVDGFCLVADADELVVMPDTSTAVARYMRTKGFELAYGYLVDHFGSSDDPTTVGDRLFGRFPVAALATWLATNGSPRKVSLVASRLEIGEGQHYAHTRAVAPLALQVRHFKWIDGSAQRIQLWLDRLRAEPDLSGHLQNYIAACQRSLVIAEWERPEDELRALRIPTSRAASGVYLELDHFAAVVPLMGHWRPGDPHPAVEAI